MRHQSLARSACVIAGLLLAAAPASAQGPQAPEPSLMYGSNFGAGLGTGGPDRHALPGSSGAGARIPYKLDEADEIATLEAIRFALSEVADGSSYVWYREHGRLNGLVNPTSSFKDGKGRVCRHMVLIMSAGAQSRRIEGVACRDTNGRWLLEG